MSTTPTATTTPRAWVVISHEAMERTERLTVEGGYLYRTTVWATGSNNSRAVSTAMVFKPSTAVAGSSLFDTPVSATSTQPSI